MGRARTSQGRVVTLLTILLGVVLAVGEARAEVGARTGEGAAPTLGIEGRAEEAKRKVSWLAVPVVAYTPETSGVVAMMAMVFVPSDGEQPDMYQGAAAYTFKRQMIAELRGRTHLKGGRWMMMTHLQARRWREDYFGLGNGVGKDSELFSRKEVRGRFGLRRQVLRRGLYLGAFFSGAETTIGATGRLREDAPRGMDGGWLNGAGVEIMWDQRDSMVGPRKGFYFQAEIESWHRTFGSNFDATNFRLDSRRYIELAPNHTLALQLAWRAQRGDVPFYRLNSIGGARLMRGIYEGRFRDRHLCATQFEYRSPTWNRLSGVAFAGLGAVSRDAQLRMNEARWAAGVGGRVLLDAKKNVNLRLDAGKSADDFGVYLSIGEAF